MSIVKGAAYYGQVSTVNVNVTFPTGSGAAVGDWVIVSCHGATGTAFTMTFGRGTWAQLCGSPATNLYVNTNWRQLDATDIANGYVTAKVSAGSTDAFIAILDGTLVTGLDASVTLPVTPGTRGGVSQATVTAPAVTPTSAGQGLLCSVERTSATGTTVSSIGFGTQDFFAEATGTNQSTSLLLAHVSLTPGSSSGSDTVTYSGGSTNALAFILPLTGSVTQSATVGMAGSGTLGASGLDQIPSTATLAGAGTLTASVSGNPTATVTLAGSGALTATGTETKPATTALAGAGTLGVTPTVQTFLQAYLAAAPTYWIHHGGEVSWPPRCTAQAYANADAWNPTALFEAPVVQCSTGEYVLSETATTVDYNSVVTISTTPWSTLSTLRTTVGGYPMMRLKEDFLDVWGSSGHPLMVDNKLQQNDSALLALLANYGGPDRIGAKGYYTATTWLGDAKAAGYLLFAFYYDTDSANFASTVGSFDYVGLNYGGTQAAWTSLFSFGKPIWAHILDTSTSKATADSKAATAGGVISAYMVSDVIDIVPHTGGTSAPVAMAGAGTLGASPVDQIPSTATLAGAGVLAVAALDQVPSTVTMAGAGTIAASGTDTQPSTVTLAGAGTLSAGGTDSIPAAPTLSGAGTLTVGGQDTITGAITLAGVGVLAASPQGSQLGTASMSGAGTLTVTGQQTGYGAIALTGTGTLSATVLDQIPTAAVFAGAGTVTVVAYHLMPITATLAGAGVLTVTGSSGPPGGVTVTMAGAGTLSATGRLLATVVAALAGAGSLTVGGQVVTPTGPVPTLYLRVRNPAVLSGRARAVPSIPTHA